MKLNRINPAALSVNALSKASGRINDGGGLALLPNYKGNAGQHRWIFRGTLNGKAFEMGFGTLAEVSLAAARDKAVAARQQVGRGEDPRAERQDKRAADLQAIEDERRARLGLPVAGSFKDWATQYATSKAGTWVAATRAEFDSQLEKHVFPTIGNAKIAAVTRLQLVEMFRAIPGTAVMHAVRKKVNQVFNFAVDSEAIGKNPADGIQRVLPKHVGGNNPAVETAEALADVLNKFAAYAGGQIMRTAMMVQAYLFQRSDVSASMEWAHINLDRALWTVPGANMKRSAEDKETGGAHIVPLPRQIVAMLRDLHALTGGGRFVFPNAVRADDHMTADAINNAMQSALGKRRGQEWSAYQTAHGFRALGISFGQKYCGEDKRVLDIIAGHKIGDNLGTAYERNQWEEERAPALQAYADWLDAIRAGKPDAFLTRGERERAALAAAPAPQAANAPTVDAARWARFLAFEAAEAAAQAQQAA
ncbi:MAG TPA: integrase arm-type DNA-binding domain-containing protein [Xanthobacteraceae bacterium]|nr:integrase arm-type DNA-binding domain-containing protein [Xanthobacteraceae bacterium]